MSRRLRWWAIATLAVTAAVAIVAVAATRRQPPRTLAGAIAVANDDRRFASSPEAAKALADISRILVADARACAARHGADARRCSARASGAAIAQSAAVSVLRCTQPGVYAARTGVLTYLRDIERIDRDRRAQPPRFPELPVC